MHDRSWEEIKAMVEEGREKEEAENKDTEKVGPCEITWLLDYGRREWRGISEISERAIWQCALRPHWGARGCTRTPRRKEVIRFSPARIRTPRDEARNSYGKGNGEDPDDDRQAHNLLTARESTLLIGLSISPVPH